MKRLNIPPTTVARLPLYLRCLESVRRQVDSISSQELAELTGRNAAQLRKDLSYLGEFGTRGVGYEVDELIRQISKWLGVVTVRSVVIVGAGHLGQALCNYRGFIDKNFEVREIYDNQDSIVGRKVGGLTVKHIDELTASGMKAGIDIGIVATPAESAQAVVDKLTAAGVKSILNFAPATINADVCVRNVDLSVELQIIGFHLASVEHGLTSDCCD